MSGRPWEFVAIVHGFPDKIVALQFEWAFQHAGKSLQVRDALGDKEAGTLGRKRGVPGKLALLKAMVNECENFLPFPLTVYFLDETRRQEFLAAKYSKEHDCASNRPTVYVDSVEDMPFWVKTSGKKGTGKVAASISTGSATVTTIAAASKCATSTKLVTDSTPIKNCRCYLCNFTAGEDETPVICQNCSQMFHEFCLEDMDANNQEVECPSCKSKLDWSPDCDDSMETLDVEMEPTLDDSDSDDSTIDCITKAVSRRLSIEDTSSTERNIRRTVTCDSDSDSESDDSMFGDSTEQNNPVLAPIAAKIVDRKKRRISFPPSSFLSDSDDSDDEWLRNATTNIRGGLQKIVAKTSTAVSTSTISKPFGFVDLDSDDASSSDESDAIRYQKPKVKKGDDVIDLCSP